MGLCFGVGEGEVESLGLVSRVQFRVRFVFKVKCSVRIRLLWKLGVGLNVIVKASVRFTFTVWCGLRCG